MIVCLFRSNTAINITKIPGCSNFNNLNTLNRSHGCDSNDSSFVVPSDVCLHCNEGTSKFPKSALEALLRCKDCPAKG